KQQVPQRIESRHVAHVYSQRAAAARLQHLEVAARLGRLHDSERVTPAGDLEVGRVVARDLQEHTAVRPALVGLAGRMEKAWPEAGAGGDLAAVANPAPNF